MYLIFRYFFFNKNSSVLHKNYFYNRNTNCQNLSIILKNSKVMIIVGCKVLTSYIKLKHKMMIKILNKKRFNNN